MTLIENMTLAELDREMKIQQKRIISANAELEKIHGKKDYSDEIARYFHLGKVGFRTDSKRQSQTLERSIDNGVKACEYYDIIEAAKNRIYSISRTVNFIVENKGFGETERQIKDNQNRIAVESAGTLKWEKVAGHYGVAYRHGNFIVERVDAGFVALRDDKGNLIAHYKTVKEAKAKVSIALARHDDNPELLNP